MIYIFYLLIYGFLLTAVIGLLASWIDRKVTARVQYRVGPSILQPLIDIVKLLGKETLIPRGASRITFLIAPVIGLASVILVSTLLWVNNINSHKRYPDNAWVAELVDARDLKSLEALSSCGFDSRLRHLKRQEISR